MDIIAPTKITNDAQAALPVWRATANGTYWDRNGVLQTAAANTPRITYDPLDLSAAPYLMLEPASTNLIGPSSQFQLWGFTPPALTVTTDAALAPDGTMSADVVSNTSGSDFNSTYTAVPTTAGVVYVFSVFAAFDSSNEIDIRLISGASDTFVRYSLASGSIPYNGPGVVASAMTKCGNWYRVEISVLAQAATLTAYIYPCTQYASGRTGSVRLWGAQIEQGSRASSYILGEDPTHAAYRPPELINPGVGVGLLWSNVVENDTDDGALWNAATAYAAGARVRRPNHRSYIALKATTGNIPENTSTGDAAAFWQDVGPTKRWAVFDNKYSTIASAPDAVHYLLRPGSVATAVGALGLEGNDVRVSMIDANTGALVYRSTKSLRIKNCRSITDYCFKPIARRRDEVFDDLPPFKNCILLVTVTKKASVAQVADIVVGRLEYAGETQWAPEIRSKRRSIVTDNGFGDLTFQKRRKSKLLTVDVTVDNNLVDDTVRLVDTYTDEPCVIIGDARWTVLIVLGFITDFRLVLESPAGSIYNAQIEGFA